MKSKTDFLLTKETLLNIHLITLFDNILRVCKSMDEPPKCYTFTYLGMSDEEYEYYFGIYKQLAN